MFNILDSFLNYKLIENIDGSDERYKKLEAASERLAQIFSEKPSQLIQAILSGISPQATLTMPIVALAKDCIQQEWKSVSSAYTDEPINLYRGAILQACNLVSEKDNNASIMWLTACDIFPTLELGKEEKDILTNLMNHLAILAEKNTILDGVNIKPLKEKPIKIELPEEIETPRKYVIHKEILCDLLGGAAGAQYSNAQGQTIVSSKANRYHPHSNPIQWAGDFATLMSDLLASEFEDMSDNLHKNISSSFSKTFENTLPQITESINSALNAQRLSIQNYQKNLWLAQKQEQTKLNVLWWSEALYSTSHKRSYREYTPEIASVIMPYDLLEQITSPSPISVAYGLSETVNKLPGSSFEEKQNFLEYLTKIRNSRSDVDISFMRQLSIDTVHPCLNIRDLICKALTDQHCDLEILIKNSLIPDNWQCSLPFISKAIFRQEQALKLAQRDEE